MMVIVAPAPPKQLSLSNRQCMGYIVDPSSSVSWSWYVISVMQDPPTACSDRHSPFGSWSGSRSRTHGPWWLVSLVSATHGEVNKVSRNVSALPLDRLPLEREQWGPSIFPSH